MTTMRNPKTTSVYFLFTSSWTEIQLIGFSRRWDQDPKQRAMAKEQNVCVCVCVCVCVLVAQLCLTLCSPMKSKKEGGFAMTSVSKPRQFHLSESNWLRLQHG